MLKAGLVGFHDNDLILKPYQIVPDIDPKIGQSLAYLMGRYTLGQTWHTVQTDINGRLLVGNASASNTVANQFLFVALNAESALIGANPNRIQLLIQNQGQFDVFVALVAGLAQNALILMTVGSSLSFDNWLGSVYVSTPQAGQTSNISVLEY